MLVYSIIAFDKKYSGAFFKSKQNKLIYNLATG
jgi:hypothetical protein